MGKNDHEAGCGSILDRVLWEGVLRAETALAIQGTAPPGDCMWVNKEVRKARN